MDWWGIVTLKTSRNGVNNMWILKNSTSLLSSLDQRDVRTVTSVQTFDLSTLYTSNPHNVLKCRISTLVHNAFRKKDRSVRYTHIKVTRAKGYFTHDINGGGDEMYTADVYCRFQWEPVVLHYLLTFSYTHMRTNFQTIWSEVATGDLPGRLIYAIDTSMIWLFSITRSFCIISKRYIHPSWLLNKLTNQITWQTALISHSS